jgi:hypothetical protein
VFLALDKIHSLLPLKEFRDDLSVVLLGYVVFFSLLFGCCLEYFVVPVDVDVGV